MLATSALATAPLADATSFVVADLHRNVTVTSILAAFQDGASRAGSQQALGCSRRDAVAASATSKGQRRHIRIRADIALPHGCNCASNELKSKAKCARVAWYLRCPLNAFSMKVLHNY